MVVVVMIVVIKAPSFVLKSPSPGSKQVSVRLKRMLDGKGHR